VGEEDLPAGGLARRLRQRGRNGRLGDHPGSDFLYRETGDTVVDATHADGAHDGGPADRMDRGTTLGQLRSLNGGTVS
jgi:hypothetical protein